ncbi:MAG: PD-(D/E)XK nuclease-like domain-containing protein [Phycisphaerae bacterium]|nr:PD-(D/E)XK nuclease-like domain-containing protein [Phycisphaerae bacterium]
MLKSILPVGRKNGSNTAVLKALSYLVQESEAEYRAQAESHLTGEDLSAFRRNPCLYDKRKFRLAANQESPPSVVDRAAHVLILQRRDRFEEAFAISGALDDPLDDVTGQAGVPPRTVLDADEAALIDELAASVWSHRLAIELLSRGMVNGVIRTTHKAMAAQAWLDWMHPIRGLVELKLCDHLEWFPDEARAFGYLHELAFARVLILAACGIAVPGSFIAVEKRQPHRTGVFTVSEKVLGEAQRENEEALERLAQCRATDCWPTGYEEQRTIDRL